ASVVYEGQDIENGDESMPYASRFAAPYARSKAEAEQLVLSRASSSLRTTAIRPHVVFGPGDTRFLPAVLKRAKAGKLKLGVGRRQNLSDFTYIDNLIDALLLADGVLKSDAPVASGEAYFVSNGIPMDFFDFVGRVLAELELPPIRGRVPFAVAYGAAAVAERWQAWRGHPAGLEDGLSTFAVRYMCTHHYFSIEKAHRDLGYTPKVDLEQGIQRTCTALKAEGWG
ncbi:MAG: NAD-dependent epimerase/dehydratase family protein, partial [Myxococcota bacterium]